MVAGFITEKYLLNFKAQTIKVVLSGEDALKNAVEKNWTYTKYEFITDEQLKSKYKNNDKVFLMGIFQAE